MLAAGATAALASAEGEPVVAVVSVAPGEALGLSQAPNRRSAQTHTSAIEKIDPRPRRGVSGGDGGSLMAGAYAGFGKAISYRCRGRPACYQQIAAESDEATADRLVN